MSPRPGKAGRPEKWLVWLILAILVLLFWSQIINWIGSIGT